ncbi:MAG: hypothetical protein M1828_004074 [Chrysothrix sp. TS-e1954]|nr:MAG: hypothetical protein M1828_004074 [Chrysothrix sp. TS-e1954]
MALRISLPPITRLVLAAFTFCSIANLTLRITSGTYTKRIWINGVEQSPYYPPYLTLVPGQSILYPWVFVTATFAEQNIFGLLVTGATLWYGGRYLERAWGGREFVLFAAVVSVGSTVLTFVSYIGLFVLVRDTRLVTTAISGGISLQAGFLVTFKQLVPEHTVSLFSNAIRIRVKHFPAIFLLANTISGVLFGTDTATLLAWYGFLISWAYLRFYRVSPSSLAGVEEGEAGKTMKGDASDTFAFKCFWPDVVQGPIGVVADRVYDVMVAMKVCTPFSAEDVESGNEAAAARGVGEVLPSLMGAGRGSRGGGRREEAERRRALALRALDQRLQSGGPRQAPPTAQLNSSLPMENPREKVEEEIQEKGEPPSTALEDELQTSVTDDGARLGNDR